MKPILIYVLVMTLIWTAILIALAPKAHAASNLQTRFALIVNTTDGKSVYTEPTPAGKKLALPAAFSNIDCVLSDDHVDGKEVMRVLSCTDTTATFRTVATCPTDRAGADASTMAISVDETNTVFFLLGCETNAGTKKSNPSTAI